MGGGEADLRFVRSFHAGARFAWAARRRISRGAGASRGFVSPDVSSGECLPSGTAVVRLGITLAVGLSLSSFRKKRGAVAPTVAPAPGHFRKSKFHEVTRQPLLWAAC